MNPVPQDIGMEGSRGKFGRGGNPPPRPSRSFRGGSPLTKDTFGTPGGLAFPLEDPGGEAARGFSPGSCESVGPIKRKLAGTRTLTTESPKAG